MALAYFLSYWVIAIMLGILVGIATLVATKSFGKGFSSFALISLGVPLLLLIFGFISVLFESPVGHESWKRTFKNSPPQNFEFSGVRGRGFDQAMGRFFKFSAGSHSINSFASQYFFYQIPLEQEPKSADALAYFRSQTDIPNCEDWLIYETIDLKLQSKNRATKGQGWLQYCPQSNQAFLSVIINR